jgi:tetratricopeptide (TPR) repeat protein
VKEDRASKLRAEAVEAVVAALEPIEQRARDGDHNAISELLDAGFQLADAGWEYTLEPVLSALQAAATRGDLDASQMGWLANLQGRSELHTGRPAVAEDAFRRAADLGHESDDRILVSSAMLNLGIVAFKAGRDESAISHFRASNRARPADDSIGRAQGYVNLASAYLDSGDLEAARRALRSARRSEGIEYYASIRSSIAGVEGLVEIKRGNPQRAIALFRESARLAQSVPSWSHLLPAMQNVGAAYLDLGRIGPSIRWLRRADRLARLILATEAEVSISRTLATALYRSRRIPEAREVLDQARSRAAERGDMAGRAEINSDLGALAFAIGDFAGASEALEEALTHFARTDDIDKTVAIARSIVSAMVKADRVGDAFQFVNDVTDRVGLPRERQFELKEGFASDLADVRRSQAVGVLRELEQTLTVDDSGAVETQWRISMELSSLGEYSAAVRGLTRALKWSALRRHDSIDLYYLLNDRAISYLNAGNNKLAQRDLKEALAETQAAQDRAMEAVILGNLSESSRRIQNWNQSREYATRAIRVAMETGDDAERGRSLTMLALAERSIGNEPEASRAFEEALELARRIGDKSTEAVALGGLGGGSYASHDWERAIQEYTLAAEIERSSRDAEHEVQSLAALVELSSIVGDAALTRRHAQRLVDIVQSRKVALDIGLLGLQRAARACLERGDSRQAGDLFLVEILVALAEWDGKSSTGMKRIVRAILAPYGISRTVRPQDAHAIDRRLRRRLKARTKDAYPLIEGLLNEASKALQDVG